jgi:hypothetical protein
VVWSSHNRRAPGIVKIAGSTEDDFRQRAGTAGKIVGRKKGVKRWHGKEAGRLMVVPGSGIQDSGQKATDEHVARTNQVEGASSGALAA